MFGTVPVFSLQVCMSYRTYRRVRYRYWCRTELTEVSGTGIDVPKLPKCTVPVWKSVPVPAAPVSISYRSYRSVRYRYWCHTELSEVYGADIDVVPKLPKCLVLVLTKVCRTELTEVSGTDVDVVPNLPKYPVPVLMSYRTYRSVLYRYWCTELAEVTGTGNTGGMPRFVPCQTYPSLYAV